MTDMLGRWIAVDTGRRHVGCAVCDALGMLARPLVTLAAQPESELLTRLVTLARDEEAAGFVVGLPVNMDGSEGKACAFAREFARRLQKASGLPVELEDERLSSWEAEGLLIERGMKPSHRRKRVHEASAVIILQSFLRRRKAAFRPAPEEE